MTAEEHIKLTIGSLVFDNAILKAKLEELTNDAGKSGTKAKRVRQGTPSEESR